jgi:hypothetical protein
MYSKPNTSMLQYSNNPFFLHAFLVASLLMVRWADHFDGRTIMKDLSTRLAPPMVQSFTRSKDQIRAVR